MTRPVREVNAPIRQVEVAAFEIPTDGPESDGTLEWDRTTLVLVNVTAGEHVGLGYTYADKATARFIKATLASTIHGLDAMDIPGVMATMKIAVRNLGHSGVAAMAISAVDVALWDLKARLLGLPLVTLLGAVRPSVPVYGSGGFTSYTVERLAQQLKGWVSDGTTRVKMKVGRVPAQDPARVRAARAAIGPEAELFVDANGAYGAKQALHMAEVFAGQGVSWFEEPVSSDHLDDLRLVRDRAPSGMDIAAGEYGYDLFYFRRMLQAGSIDVLQADGSRCDGITGFVQVGALCEAYGIALSAHCAPSLHVHAACALRSLRHLEYFYDHARIEHMLFDGALRPTGGVLTPDRSRPGLGIEFKRSDASRFEV